MSKLKTNIPSEAKTSRNKQEGFAFGRENYVILVVGIVLIAVGFLLMIGGGSDDPNVFSPELFSTRRLTVAPIVCLLGFSVVVAAIMKTPKD